MRIRRTLVPCLGLLLASTTLTGCGDNSAAKTGNELTPPGTQLSLGESATVPIEDRGVIELTVTDVEQASQRDIVGVKDENFDADTETIYYIRYSVKVVSETDKTDAVHGELGIGSLDIFSAVRGRSGSDSTLPLATGRPGACAVDEDLTADPTTGQSFTMCSPEVLPKTGSLDAVWSNQGSAAYDPLEDGEPVVWKP